MICTGVYTGGCKAIHERLDYLCEALHFDFELIEPLHCGSVKRLHCTGVWWLHWRMHW